MDSRGASFSDFDNDGWADLYVLNYGANVLYRNEQGQGFTNVTVQAGVGDTGDGRTASWADYDGDGWLDLYVANWSCEPLCGHPSLGDRDRLYHNNGDGTFDDVIGLLEGGGSTTGAGFVATWVDYDNDGDPDIYLVNDEFINPVGNMLWRNDGPGCDGWCFTQVAKEAGANTYVMGMGLGTADYDNDGDFDFYFSNVGLMTLLQNQGDGTFENVAADAGVEVDPGAVGWGTVFFDFNNDGWQDIYLALEDMTSRGSPANPLYENQGDGTFRRVLDNGADDPDRTVGVAAADWNNDGFVEMVVGNYDEGYKLYQNLGDLRPGQRLALPAPAGQPGPRPGPGQPGRRGHPRHPDRLHGPHPDAGSQKRLQPGRGGQPLAPLRPGGRHHHPSPHPLAGWAGTDIFACAGRAAGHPSLSDNYPGSLGSARSVVW